MAIDETRDVKKFVVGFAGLWKLRMGPVDRKADLVSSGSRCARRRGLCRTLRVNDMFDSALIDVVVCLV